MVSELRIYFEGDARLRPGFHKFLSQIVQTARARQCRVDLIATGGTPVADFHAALIAHPNAFNVLVLDSDGPIDGSLADLYRSKKLDPKLQDSVFWMVQLMESWFLADIGALKAYYRDGFIESAVTGNPAVEEILNADVYARLKRATKETKRGEYHKTKHAADLLARIDPSRVRSAAPNCDRMFPIILEKLAEN